MPPIYPGHPLFDRLRFPHPGTKLRFRGTNEFWFTDMKKNAKRLLTKGQTYTLKDIAVYSSWACIQLEEFPAADFPLSFFDYEKPARS